eukprot:CAMPEP_0197650814 /NCGR_PEP_ID=MMETSP1338-20131121/31175_1 /TAXON_ID=43686 ORGANISM="Pelagodinium beii, Strain RCC1491" /NCGR_SAMPLE_ID=MMETSP1338 /ASSEMBLY_ACC=CAM_ASM_000754 /LENGTH=187 /DNA_ID=CAMNT_0043225297 /DNA_START=70 /DNA_END=633 /DNA_ORIENTATION=+
MAADTKPFLESELLMWKQPAKTGLAMGAFNAFFIVFNFVEMSLTPFLCSLGMFVIIVGGAVKFAAPQVAEQSVELMSKETIHAAVESIATLVNIATVQVRDMVMWTNNQTTIKALVGLQVVRRMSPYFSILFVAWLAGNLLFTLPFLLEAKKDEIQKHVGPALQKAKSFKDDLLAKVPKHSDAVKDE